MKKTWLLGILVWIGFSWLQIGFDSPDEHFPTLEAASFLAKGWGTLTWEWASGLRSWLPPVILAIPLKFCMWIGIESPIFQDHILRTFISLIWLLSVRRAQVTKTATQSQIYWLLLGAPLVIWGTRFGLDTLCFAPILLTIVNVESGKPRLGGLFAALAFMTRFTSAIPLLVYLFFKLRDRKTFLNFVLSFSMVFAMVSLFDAGLYSHYTGKYEFPAWRFFHFNVIDGAGQFHASPWYESWLYLLALWTPVLGFFLSPWRNRTYFFPVFISVCTFSIIRHTELRFVFPLLVFTVLSQKEVPSLFRKFAIGLNWAMIFLAAVLYTEPHGGLVKGLYESSKQIRSSTHAIAMEGYTGAGLPLFYLKTPAPVFQIDTENWKLWCSGSRPKEISITAHDHREWRVLSETPCDNSTQCRLLKKIDLGLGYRLRQVISHTRGLQYVYDCSLPRS